VTYAAFFEEQPGFIASPGMRGLATKARRAGLDVGLWAYGQWTTALTAAQAHLRLGQRVILCGSGTGVVGVGWVQQRLPVDLCIGVEPSPDCDDYPLVNPVDSLLIFNPPERSNLLGFQRIMPIDQHYLFLDCDPRLKALVMREIKTLAKNA
jgi:hypothetical protein